MADLRSFLTELKRRKVYHVAAAYVAVGVAIAVSVPDVFGAFEAPPWAARLVIALLVIGFPVALVLAWAYEVRPDEGEASSATATGRAPGPGGVTDPASGPEGAAPPDSSKTIRWSRSIAVLPFENMSEEAGSGYFADGISEELTHALARIPDLQVAARTSAFTFKGGRDDVREIGARLGVAHVVEGSVRPGLIYLSVVPRQLGLHGDPRYARVLERMGLGHLAVPE